MSRLMDNNKNGIFTMVMNYISRGLLALLLATQMAFVGATETITYYHNDALGSPVAATDEAGNLLWREAYRPFGSRLLKEDGGTNDTWYTGKQEDSGAGLSYFGARWYEPNIGRFMAIDPVGFKESNIHTFNRYAYANNNPYKFVDPDGREALVVGLGNLPENPKAGKGTVITFIAITSVVTLPYMLTTTAGRIAWALIENPFMGVVMNGGEAPTSGIVTKGLLARGRAAEQRVLNDLGLSKNTQKVRTGEGASIPDALTKRQSIEIKDCIGVSCTKQIRIQTEAARNSGRQSTLITGDKTHVSGPAQRAFDNIIRRPDLGPQ